MKSLYYGFLMFVQANFISNWINEGEVLLLVRVVQLVNLLAEQPVYLNSLSC